MQTLLEIGLSNAVVAALLALLAGASRLIRRPALTHSLWLLVLLKLITPPLFTLPITWSPPETAAIEQGQPERQAEVTTFADQEGRATLLPTVQLPSSSEISIAAKDESQHPQTATQTLDARPTSQTEDESAFSWPTPGATPQVAWESAISALWLLGCGLWFIFAAASIVRFRRALRYARPATTLIRAQAEELAQRLGLPHCPHIALLPGAVSPMLWALGGRPRLLLPSDLFERLPEGQRATLLAHELAHLRRRDHWVRVLELLVTGLFWWHPVVWWARREIREAEEQCCDAWVLWALPAAARTYADALLETIDFLSRGRLALPQAASGIGQVHLLRRRLTMIMRGTNPKALSAAGLLAVLGLAAVLLPLRPTWAQPESPRHADEEKPEAIKDEIEQARQALAQAKANVVVQKTRLAVAEKALKQAEESLSQAYTRWKELKQSGPEQAIRVYPVENLVPPIPRAGATPNPQAVSADRLAQLEKKLDALREEIELLRLQTGQVNRVVRPPARVLHQARVFQGHGLAVTSVAWSPDGKLALSGSHDTAVRLWDVASGRAIRFFKGHIAKVLSVAFSPDGRHVLSGAYDDMLILWDLETGKEVRRLGPVSSRMKSVAFSPDGRRALTGGEDGYVRIWELKTGKEIYSDRLNSPLLAVAFSPDGKLVATGCSDGSLYLFDAASLRQHIRFDGQMGHKGGISQVAFSPDGRRIASASADGTVHLWDVATGRIVVVLKGGDDKVACVAFSPDGRRLATGGLDRKLWIWDVAAGYLLSEGTDNSPVLSVAFSPDGRFLLSGGDDGAMRSWAPEN